MIEEEREKFKTTNQEFLDVNLFVFRHIFLIMPVMTLVMNLMIVCILYFGAYDALNSSILTGDIIAFIQVLIVIKYFSFPELTRIPALLNDHTKEFLGR